MAIGTAAAILGSAVIGGVVSSKSASSAAKSQTNASNNALAAQTAAAAQARADQQRGVKQADSILQGGQYNALRVLADGVRTSNERTSLGYQRGTNALNNAYNTQSGIFQPTIDSGLAASAARDYTLGIGAKPSGYQGFDQSEYFQSQLRNGQQAVDQSAAAGGNMFSGATLKALQQSGSDLAYRTQGEYLGNLNSVSAQGQTAGGNLASAAGNLGAGLANIGIDHGNAMAAQATAYAANKANIYSGTAGARANAYAGLGSNLSNVSLGLGDAQAQGAYGIGNAQAAGAIGQGNAVNNTIQNALSGWQYNQQMNQANSPYGQAGMGSYSGGLY